MINDYVVLFHFINLALGMTALLVFLREGKHSEIKIRNPFINQALLYNIAVLLTAVLDFMYFYFWKQVSINVFAVNFLTLISVLNLSVAIMWCFSFVIMVYKFLDIEIDLRRNKFFKGGVVTTVIILCLCYISSAFKIIPGFFGFSALAFGYLIFSACLGYSIFLFKKSTMIENHEKTKSLKILGLLFIFFSIVSLYIYVDVYPLRLLPIVARKFSLNFVDFLFNSFSLFWFIKYFRFVISEKKQEPVEELNEVDFANKFNISKRELEVIRLVCDGKSNQEIGDILFISVGTVKDHLYKIFKKIGVKNRTQLAKLF